MNELYNFTHKIFIYPRARLSAKRERESRADSIYIEQGSLTGWKQLMQCYAGCNTTLPPCKTSNLYLLWTFINIDAM